ncbi:MAG: Small-conductance mechanosensitive channel [Pseudomonadales bacterium]|nr:Small-conductance mechanosensitive channel [Pseudomonadales bacterium]
MDRLTELLGQVERWNGMASTGLRIVVILLVSWLLLGLSRRIIPALKRQMQRRASDPEQIKRLDTLGRVVRYVCAVLIAAVTVMLVLAELGVSIAPLLASAGVIGIAVGFGAQSLIKDYFNGLFMLLEDQVRQGDVVELGGKAGLVEEITLRHIRLRDYDGNVHYVPSGVVSTVTNRSRGFAYAVIDVGVAYREDVDAVFDVMREAGAQMRGDEQFGAMILDELEIAGVENWADSAVILRCRFRVQPLQQWTVRREYLRRLKKRFDALGIEIPFPHLTVYQGDRIERSTSPA